jgi:hypothetical protein
MKSAKSAAVSLASDQLHRLEEAFAEDCWSTHEVEALENVFSVICLSRIHYSRMLRSGIAILKNALESRVEGEEDEGAKAAKKLLKEVLAYCRKYNILLDPG